MSGRLDQRVCAEIDEGVVVFLIGMRINKLWKFWKWFAVARAMPRMLAELAADKELGLLEARPHFGLRNLWMLQYWRSAADLNAYAHAAERAHLPAWAAFNRLVGVSGDVGIWHETYVVGPGRYETVYVNMPPFGLGRVGRLVPATGARRNAAGRLGGK